MVSRKGGKDDLEWNYLLGMKKGRQIQGLRNYEWFFYVKSQVRMASLDTQI